MYRVHINIEEVGREMYFDFPQTIARDEVIHKIFSTNKAWKEQLEDPTGQGIYPGIVIRWENLDAEKPAEKPEEVSHAKPEELEVPHETPIEPTEEKITETDAG